MVVGVHLHRWRAGGQAYQSAPTNLCLPRLTGVGSAFEVPAKAGIDLALNSPHKGMKIRDLASTRGDCRWE